MLWNTKTIKQRYQIKRRYKYLGDPSKVVARSSWELACFMWCENHPDIKRWGSETVKINYINPADRKQHSYIVDLLIEWKNGKIELVEIKPKRQTVKPIWPNKRTKKYISEALEYVRNKSKWESATKFAKSRGWIFSIWHEETLKQKGINIR